MEAIDRTYHFKKTLEKKERFVGGHRLCAGCGAGIAVRGVLRALREEDRAVVGNATGCLEVSSFLYPYTAWEDSSSLAAALSSAVRRRFCGISGKLTILPPTASTRFRPV